jgi:hypothetical protein
MKKEVGTRLIDLIKGAANVPGHAFNIVIE